MNPLLLVGAAAAAYFFGRSKRTDSNSPTINQPTANQSPAKTSSAASGNGQMTDEELSSEALGLGTRDVSGDISNDEGHPLPIDESYGALAQEGALGFSAVEVNKSKHGVDFANGQVGNKSQDELFFRWFWLPASKVRMSELTPFEWRMTFALLSGNVHRRIDRERRYANMVLDIKQRAEMAKWGALVGKLAATALNAMVPVAGSAFAAVLNTGVGSAVSTASTGLAQDQRQMNAAAGAYRFAVDPKNLNPPDQMLLAPCWRGGEGDKIIDDKAMPWLNEQGMIFQAPAFNGNVPDKYVGTADFPWGEFGGTGRYRFAIQRRFWTSTQYGLYMPWICDEFFNRQMTTKQQVNLMARVYRAICTLSVCAFPDTSIKDPKRTSFAVKDNRPMPVPGNSYTEPVYYYKSPVMGEILGSPFPPSDEDTQITDAEGYILTFRGSRYPDYDYDDQLYGGTHFHLPSPRTLDEKKQFDQQYADRVKLGEQRKAASQAGAAKIASNSNFDYLKSLYDRRGQRDVDGLDPWKDHQFNWNEFKLLTPSMILDLPMRYFIGGTQLGGRPFNITSAMLTEVTADQRKALNTMIMKGANSTM